MLNGGVRHKQTLWSTVAALSIKLGHYDPRSLRRRDGHRSVHDLLRLRYGGGAGQVRLVKGGKLEYDGQPDSRIKPLTAPL